MSWVIVSRDVADHESGHGRWLGIFFNIKTPEALSFWTLSLYSNEKISDFTVSMKNKIKHWDHGLLKGLVKN